MKADEKRKHNYTWAIVRSQCSTTCAAGEVLLSFWAHIGYMSKLQAFTLKGIQYFGRLRWLEMRGHLQILYLGQYLKLRLTSLIYNKPSSCRLNGKGSVPIITEGTWPGPVWGWRDKLLFCWWPAITRAHTCTQKICWREQTYTQTWPRPVAKLIHADCISSFLVRPHRGWMVPICINVSMSVNKIPGVGFLMIDSTD